MAKSANPPLKSKVTTRRRSTSSVAQPALEEIIFPTQRIDRVKGSDKLPLPIRGAQITHNIEAEVASLQKENGDVYTILKFVLTCEVTDKDSGEIAVKAGLECLGRFKHPTGTSLASLKKHAARATLDYVNAIGAPVFTTAVRELDRLIASAGLPPVRLQLQMPTFELPKDENRDEVQS